jgi:hypothetical protein
LSADFLVNLLNVVADTSNGSLLVDVQVDELVRDDVHLLERKGLDASSGESLEDPALVVLLSLLNFFLNGIDNDVIINELEAGEALGDLLVVLMLCFVSDTAEGLTSRNVLPLEVLGKRSRVLFTADTGRSEEEHSLNYLTETVTDQLIMNR